MLAGPDTTASVVTIEKLHAWLTGRLRSQFIGEAGDFARATARVVTRFRDGRSPIVEFSCLASSWRETMTLLTQRADAVIMDLRSFTRQNTGCLFEIRTLIATTMPERIVFLVNSSTDLPALNQVLAREFRANVYCLEGDDPGDIQRAIWAAFGTLSESGARREAVDPRATRTTE